MWFYSSVFQENESHGVEGLKKSQWNNKLFTIRITIHICLVFQFFSQCRKCINSWQNNDSSKWRTIWPYLIFTLLYCLLKQSWAYWLDRETSNGKSARIADGSNLIRNVPLKERAVPGQREMSLQTIRETQSSGLKLEKGDCSSWKMENGGKWIFL